MGATLQRHAAGVRADVGVFALFAIEGAEAPDAGTMSGGEQQMLAMGRADVERSSCSSTSRKWASRR
jgi:ABC-type branched-subunit amino acid transport system ATPase component